MTYRIGSGAGFSGDRIDAGLPVVEAIAAAGNGGAIIFETIGERTLALGHLARRQDPALGYEPLLADYLRPILRICAEHDIVIVGNFGCANPRAAAAVIAGLARELGLPPLRIATVDGDDVRDRINLATEDLWDGDAGLPPPAGEIVSANAYLGAAAIAEAVTDGAQVVVTGRVADPALALGPLVAHFGWAWDDLDRIAAGTLVGHLLECGSQVTGGYFADPGFKDVPRPEAIGFPIAEVEADGSFVITKPPATGGLVDLRTVKEQLLYEIHDPAAYLTPDVTLDITGVEIAQAGPDRVRVSGARGHAAPARLKATVGFLGDWFGESEISYAGPNALARARLAAEVIGKRLDLRGLDLRRRIDLIGLSSAFDDDAGSLRDSPQPHAPDAAQDLRLRLAVAGPDKAAVEGALQEVLALYCCGPAGGGGQRSRVTRRIETRSYLVPREAVETTYSLT
ncbi:acyclic terpene utilization AtuA family protein [Pelagibius sp. 7325]|uniref:acyclic terpene utilization AtuA family protein n=1 Tax=Pelagibius sp. 7325 TaxID=3131994 RepID=UPI0030EE84AE